MRTEILEIIEQPNFFSTEQLLDIISDCTSDELNELYCYASHSVVQTIDDATYRRI